MPGWVWPLGYNFLTPAIEILTMIHWEKLYRDASFNIVCNTKDLKWPSPVEWLHMLYIQSVECCTVVKRDALQLHVLMRANPRHKEEQSKEMKIHRMT